MHQFVIKWVNCTLPNLLNSLIWSVSRSWSILRLKFSSISGFRIWTKSLGQDINVCWLRTDQGGCKIGKITHTAGNHPGMVLTQPYGCGSRRICFNCQVVAKSKLFSSYLPLEHIGEQILVFFVTNQLSCDRQKSSTEETHDFCPKK
jgi:hypothetical protein